MSFNHNKFVNMIFYKTIRMTFESLVGAQEQIFTNMIRINLETEIVCLPNENKILSKLSMLIF